MYTILTLAAIDTLIKSEKVDTFNIEKGLEMQQTPSKRSDRQNNKHITINLLIFARRISENLK